MHQSSSRSFGHAGILMATLAQAPMSNTWDESTRTTGDTSRFVMRNRGGKGLIAFWIGLLFSYPIVPWLYFLNHSSWTYLVIGSFLWLSAGVQLLYLPHKPKAVRLAGAELTLVFRRGEKVVDLSDVLRAEWRVSTLGCTIILKCGSGDLVTAGSLDARILGEILRRASMARPELDWRQLKDRGPSALRSVGRQMMMTKNEMEAHRRSLWKVAARYGINEKSLVDTITDRAMYDAIFWGYKLRNTSSSVAIPQPRF